MSDADFLNPMRSPLRRLTGVQIVATGSFVPDNVVTNEHLASLGCDADWIIQRTGIRERRHAPPGMSTSDMATAAAERCIQAAGVNRGDIDLLVVGTLSPDYLLPATAPIVQDRLGLNCGAMDVSAACAGFMFALVTGMQYVATGASKLALVIGADTNSRVMNPADKKTFPLFGDGAGAVLVAKGNDKQGLLSYTLGSDGSGAQLLVRPAGGSCLPLEPGAIADSGWFVKMDGRPVFKWAVRLLEDTSRQVLDAAGFSTDDVDLWLFHQANIRILDAAADALHISRDRVETHIDRYGNTSAGSVPIALDEACRRFGRDSLLLMCGFGGGLSWGTAPDALVKPVRCPPSVVRCETAYRTIYDGQWTTDNGHYSMATITKPKSKPKPKTLPIRREVKPADSWDLSSLFSNDDSWEKAFAKWEKQIPNYEQFRGTLGDGPAALAKCFAFDSEFDRAAERLGTYAYLKTAEDMADSTYQRMLGRYEHAATQAGEAASFIRPEILALPAAKLQEYVVSKTLRPFKLRLERLIRYKPHTLGPGEEKLLAMQSEMAGAADRIFRQLTDADLKFGMCKNEKGESIELSHSSFSSFLRSPSRNVRRRAFEQYYEQFQRHENSLAAAFSSSVQKDVYYAKARSYPSAREASLFHDNVPVAVYDNLIAAVRSKLPAVYDYLDLRRRKMKLRDIHHYDTYVPILSELDTRHTWNQAVNVVVDSLQPLGSEYCRVLDDGLNGRWCDRYPNQGKRSGAFSSGTFDGWPYILMNYQPDVLDHVFTLAHEAGHSMHSYYSAKHQPYDYYNYTIFVAEVASTFNEQLLSRLLMDRAKSDAQRAYLINREIDAIRGTIIRQTMFAEFEKIAHAMVEAGEPLTVEAVKTVYAKLLADYFGPDFIIDPQLKLEGLRIPHFYSAFYVYKYATGLSAAIALSERVLTGGKQELDDYLSFLKGGCSKWPLELLKDAGVDMSSPAPVETALSHFEHLVHELDELL